jgi:hypothetical protein
MVVPLQSWAKTFFRGRLVLALKTIVGVGPKGKAWGFVFGLGFDFRTGEGSLPVWG